MGGRNLHGRSNMKIAKSLNRFVCLWVVALHLIVSTIVVVGPVHAQSDNADGTPLIELEVVDTGIAGDAQVFSATIIDDGEFLEVDFFYRFDSFAEFKQIPMDVIPGTSFYTATVELLGRAPGVIEYYVNVRDADNNKVTKGFAFDPLTRLLVAPETAVTSAEPTATPTAAPPPPATSGRSTGRTILYVGLAVLAVGALAAAASGGGGGSSDGSITNPGGGPTIPVTITVDTVASGF